MRRALLFLFSLLLLLNCAKEPAGVTGLPRLEAANAANGATSTWTYGSFSQDATAFLDCLAQTVHFYGEELYMIHDVTTPAGNTQSYFQYRPVTPGGPQFYAQELESGRLYTLNNGLPINQVFHFGPDQSASWVERDIYTNVADQQDKWQAKFRMRVVRNANGDVTVDRTFFECGTM